MKKIFLLSLVSLLIGLSASSQTLHAIIFANTKSPGDPNKPGDVGIGPSVTVDLERMGIEMTTIASFINYNLKKYYYYDTPDRFSRSSLLNVINNLSCGKDDIVFFYYSGHGGRFANEESDYPEMILKVPYGAATFNEVYPLYDVYKKIMSKSPRLTIVFGDLCNSVWEKAYKDYSSNRGASVKSTSVCDIYKNLFLNVKGGLIATSSKPGQTSTGYADIGGLFTASFLECLGLAVSQGIDVSWDILFEATKNTVQKNAQPDDKGELQTPIYSTADLTISNPPTTSVTQHTQTTSNDAHTTAKDNLADALTLIANDNNEMKTRIGNISPTLSKYFNSQARVQVVGRDCKTIVNTTMASNYLNYLSIATKIEQVMVVDEKRDANGKITYLKVHEMHRE